MSYYPKDRNPSGVLFFGNAGSDQVLESASGFYYESGTSTLYATTFNGALVGNASTATSATNATYATLATDASGLTSSVTVQLSNQLAGSATFQDAGDTANISATLATAAITGQTEAPTGNGSDYVIIASGSELRKLALSNLSASLGGGTMNNWLVSADNGSTQTVNDTNQVDFSGAGNITITQDQVSSPFRVVISGNDQVNTYVAGSGLSEDPSKTFNVGAGDLITVAADTVSVDLTLAASATIVDNDYLIFLDGGAAGAESKGSTRDLASLFAGAGLIATNSTLSTSGITVQGDSGSTTLSLGETLDIGGGSGILTTVSAGSPEQVTVGLTTTAVTAGSYGDPSLGSGVTFTVDANGRLTAAANEAITITSAGVSDFTSAAETAIFTAANFVDSATIDYTVTAGDSVTAIVKDASITEAKRVRTIDSAFTNSEVITSDINLADVSAASISIRCPAPASSSGRIIYVKKVDSTANTLTIQKNGAESIDSGTQYVLYNQFESVTLACDGANWFVL